MLQKGMILIRNINMQRSYKLACIISFFCFSCSLFSLNISYPTFQEEVLYPISNPYHEEYLQVSSLHTIYVGQFGNPDGIPVLVVHGGPGAGCEPFWSSFFDPKIYRVVMFDQRGAKRSIPFAEMDQNTPQLLIQDMELLREHLGIERWYLFGGSWGSALSLLYSESHYERVLGLVLRGVFLGRERDYNHLFYGMRATRPEDWEEMVSAVGGDPSGANLIDLMHNQVMNPDPLIHLKAAHAFMRFDTLCAFLLPKQEVIDEMDSNDADALGVGRSFIHYSKNKFFIEENQILNAIKTVESIPTIIVHGRYDIICPVSQAFELHKSMIRSELWIIPDAGHASSEPSIKRALKAAMDRIRAM
jgi:proline iminopeptidase